MDHRYFDAEGLRALALPKTAAVLERAVTEVMAIQAEVASNLPSLAIDPAVVTNGMAADVHATMLIGLSVDAEAFGRVALDVAGVLRRFSPAPPALEDLLPPGLVPSGDAAGLVEQVLTLDPGLLPLPLTVLSLALVPWYMALGRTLDGVVDYRPWQGGLCPVCGQRPVMGTYRQLDGARLLECWLCRTRWVYPRLQCANCQNQDQKKLRLLIVDGDADHPSQVCDVCRHYLKHADPRVLGRDPVLALEDVATQLQDAAALGEELLPFGRSPFRNQPRS